MKYKLEIEIDLPRKKVIDLFDNPDNMRHWQEGFVSFEPLSGTPGQVGAKSRLKYIMGKRDIEMVETIFTFCDQCRYGRGAAMLMSHLHLRQAVSPRRARGPNGVQVLRAKRSNPLIELEIASG